MGRREKGVTARNSSSDAGGDCKIILLSNMVNVLK